MSTAVLRFAAAICALLCAPALSAAQERDDIRTHLAGPDSVLCLDLEVGEWQPPLPRNGMGSGTRDLRPPTRVALEHEPVAEPAIVAAAELPVRYRLSPAPGVMPSPHRHSSWQSIPAGVALSWTTRLDGLTVYLPIHPYFEFGDTVRGAAVAVSHVILEDNPAAELAPVSAVFVRCDAPLDPRERFGYRLPRGIPLGGGDSLRLAEAPPAGLLPDAATGMGSLSDYLDLEAAGITVFGGFRGADQLRVRRADDGQVIWIVLFYPDSVGFDTLVARLEAELGPAEREKHRDGATLRESAAWTSALVDIRVSKAHWHNAASPLTASLRDPRF